jgi:uncharacterized protein YndB with AHSA1/START domain
MSSPDSSREILSARVFAAPREEVFAAFRDPQRLAQWWGPQGFTNTFQEFDPQPGGRWRGTMRGPDGQQYPIAKRFVEVTAPARVVLRHEQAMHNFVMTMTFAPEGAGARLTWSLLFDSAADCAASRQFILVANEENFDRLQAHLAAPLKNDATMPGPVRVVR